jgi:flavin reductase (DIM6/NTAB) family NADH-FMN oxidoreductase RutF
MAMQSPWQSVPVPMASDLEGRPSAAMPLSEEFQRHFKHVLGHFATGVAVLTSMDDDQPIGMTVQSFSSLSLDPPLVLVCPSVKSTSWPLIASAGRLCVNLLVEGQADLARQFAISGGDKYSGVAWTPALSTRSPVLSAAGAWIDCVIQADHDGGDHRIVVCEVLDLDVTSHMKPLVFFQSGFQRILPYGSRAQGHARTLMMVTSDMDAWGW